MKRNKWAALLPVLLVIGCGESESEDTSTPTQTEPSDEQVQLEVKRLGDRLAATMTRLADVLDREDCAQAPRIKRLRNRIVAQSDELTQYLDQPAFREDVIAGMTAVAEMDAEVTDLLGACRDQQELEQTADELNKLADELEAEP